MGLIVKPGEAPPPLSSGKGADQARALAVTRSQAAEIVRNVDKWEELKAADVPQEILDFVKEQIGKGKDPDQVRRALAIPRVTSPAWKKIMSAVRAGRRIDGSALLEKLAFDYTRMTESLKKLIHDAVENGTPTLTKDGDVVMLKGPTKELSGAIDSYNRLNQGFVKLGQDLGAYIDPAESGGGRGGTTIIVQNNIPRPSKDVVAEHQKEVHTRQAILIEKQDAKQKPKA